MGSRAPERMAVRFIMISSVRPLASTSPGMQELRPPKIVRQVPEALEHGTQRTTPLNFGLDSVLRYGAYTSGTEAANALSDNNMPRL